MKKKDIEIVAPYNNINNKIKNLKKKGADAIYFGIQNLSARPEKFALKLHEMEKLSINLKKHGMKGFAAINAEYLGRETDGILKKIFNILERLEFDGVIISDLSILEIFKVNKYKIPLHISSLMGVNNKYYLDWIYQRYHPKRLILPMNLYIDEIIDIIESKNIEFEIIIKNGACYHSPNKCNLHDLHKHEKFNRDLNSSINQKFDHIFWCSENWQINYNGRKSKTGRWIGLPHIDLTKLLGLFYQIGIKNYKIEGRTLSFQKILSDVQKLSDFSKKFDFSDENEFLWKYLIQYEHIERKMKKFE